MESQESASVRRWHLSETWKRYEKSPCDDLAEEHSTRGTARADSQGKCVSGMYQEVRRPVFSHCELHTLFCLFSLPICRGFFLPSGEFIFPQMQSVYFAKTTSIIKWLLTLIEAFIYSFRKKHSFPANIIMRKEKEPVSMETAPSLVKCMEWVQSSFRGSLLHPIYLMSHHSDAISLWEPRPFSDPATSQRWADKPLTQRGKWLIGEGIPP